MAKAHVIIVFGQPEATVTKGQRSENWKKSWLKPFSRMRAEFG